MRRARKRCQRRLSCRSPVGLPSIDGRNCTPVMKSSVVLSAYRESRHSAARSPCGQRGPLWVTNGHHERRHRTSARGTCRPRGCWSYRGLKDGNSKCEKPRTRVRRNRRKRRANQPLGDGKCARKAFRRAAATATKHVELPVVVAPPTQVEPPTRIASPLMFWPALPIALMRMWLGPREAAAGK